MNKTSQAIMDCFYGFHIKAFKCNTSRDDSKNDFQKLEGLPFFKENLNKILGRRELDDSAKASMICRGYVLPLLKDFYKTKDDSNSFFMKLNGPMGNIGPTPKQTYEEILEERAKLGFGDDAFKWNKHGSILPGELKLYASKFIFKANDDVIVEANKMAMNSDYYDEDLFDKLVNLCVNEIINKHWRKIEDIKLKMSTFSELGKELLGDKYGLLKSAMKVMADKLDEENVESFSNIEFTKKFVKEKSTLGMNAKDAALRVLNDDRLTKEHFKRIFDEMNVKKVLES